MWLTANLDTCVCVCNYKAKVFVIVRKRLENWGKKNASMAAKEDKWKKKHKFNGFPVSLLGVEEFDSNLINVQIAGFLFLNLEHK